VKSPDDPLRVALLGAGHWGTVVAGQVLGDDRASLVALADVSADSREHAGRALSVPAEARFEDPHELLDAVDLDAAIVTTPHALHYEHVSAAMDRDLHVYCEKPFTTDVDDARELVRRAERRREVTMVGFQRHHEQPYLAAHDRTRDPSPKLITAEITQPWIGEYGETWRGNPDLSGGGQLYDTGSHLVDVACWLAAGRPVSVSAEMVFDDDAERVDVQALLAVRFDDGAVANLTVSGDAAAVREHVHVWADGEATYIDGRGWNDRTLREVDAANTTTTPVVDDGATRGKVEAFVDTVVEGDDPPVTVRHGFDVTAVLEAAYESARDGGRRVDIDGNLG
jgi:predicted dehydrogenase